MPAQGNTLVLLGEMGIGIRARAGMLSTAITRREIARNCMGGEPGSTNGGSTKAVLLSQAAEPPCGERSHESLAEFGGL